jgi:uncharacterized protein
MTQPPRPGDLTTIERDECVALLSGAPWVRLAFVVDGAPEVLPINVLVRDDAIYFRTATGSKLGSAAADGPVAVQADGGEERTRIGWSVVAHGHASIVVDRDVEEELFALPFEPWALPDDREFWVRITVETVSGRRIVRA